jgi:glucose/arabinose dehydrogenase
MIARRMPRMIAFLSLFAAVACGAEATAPAVVSSAKDPLLQHHEIRADRLPPPYATPSAGNPPVVLGRPSGAALHVPPGFKVEVWASSLSDPRSMVLAPNGDVFVSEPGAGRIDVFRAGRRFTFAEGLDSPFGLAFHGNFLYVGNENAVVRFPYTSGQTAARGKPETIAPLPGGGHSTRNVLFNRAGTKMYVAIGSTSNVSPEAPPRAAIMEFNPDGTGRRVFASGLRNPVGLAWNPATGALWTAVNERDGLGEDLVPDFVTEVRDGAFYGWPYSYIGQHVDPRRKGEHPELVAKAVVPSVLIASHSAALGIAFYDGKMFPPEYRGDLFVALHGSWNREQRTGYKVVRVPMRNRRPAGGYDDFMVGWSTDPSSRRVWGRPVSLLVLPDGSMLVSDDGGEVIWRVSYG